MPLFFSIAGTHPVLSYAEFKAVFPEAKIAAIGYDGWVFSCGDTNKLNRLAGIVKWGEIYSTLPGVIGIHKDAIGSLILEKVSDKKKIRFGISVYDFGSGDDHVKKLRRNFKRGGIEIKKWLRERGVASRFVTSREETLSSVVAVKQRLVRDSGIEVCILIGSKNTYLGRTLGVQDFEAWSRRDYGRPARDAREGMLPPKIARAMINLAGVKEGGIILDPFCGSGTVLMEAHLLGYRILGSDLQSPAVERALKNLAWLRVEARLFVSDARSLSEHLKFADAIVTEPDLGPPLNGREKQKELQENTDRLSELYVESFESFSKILIKGGRAVFVFPAFRFRKEIIRTYTKELEKKIERFGFIKKDLVNSETAKRLGGIVRDGGIVYSRPGKFIEREIFVFEKL